jgi:hypothetical protein
MIATRAVPALLLAAGSAGALAASATAQPTEPAARRGEARQLSRCLDTTFVSNWEPIDDHTVLAWAGSRPFQLTTSRCSALTSPLPRIKVVVRGGSQVCSPHDLQLYVSAGDIPAPCFVQTIEPLTQVQAKALEKASR